MFRDFPLLSQQNAGLVFKGWYGWKDTGKAAILGNHVSPQAFGNSQDMPGMTQLTFLHVLRTVSKPRL